MNKAIFLCAALLTAACGQTQTSAETTNEASPTLEIRDAWAGPTPGGVDVSAGYLTIANSTGFEDRLIAVSSPRAARAEIHDMNVDQAGVMRMRAISELRIPAGDEAALAPGGMHLMFFGVTQPFVVGEDIPVRFTFARAGEVNVALPVRAGATHSGDHGSGH